MAVSLLDDGDDRGVDLGQVEEGAELWLLAAEDPEVVVVVLRDLVSQLRYRVLPSRRL